MDPITLTVTLWGATIGLCVVFAGFIVAMVIKGRKEMAANIESLGQSFGKAINQLGQELRQDITSLTNSVAEVERWKIEQETREKIYRELGIKPATAATR